MDGRMKRIVGSVAFVLVSCHGSENPSIGTAEVGATQSAVSGRSDNFYRRNDL